MTRLPRPREVNIIISKNPFQWKRLQYNTQTHEIVLPNMCSFLLATGRKPSETDFVFSNLVESFSHEMMHKILHEFIGYKSMLMWDLLDKAVLGKERIEVYNISSL